MITKKKIFSLNTSLAITLPPDYLEWFGWSEGTELILEDKKGPKGKFLVIYEKPSDEEE